MAQARTHVQFLTTTSFSDFSILPHSVKHFFTVYLPHTLQTDRDWLALVQHAEQCHAVVHTTENYHSTAQHVLKPLSSVTTKPVSDTTQDKMPRVSAACRGSTAISPVMKNPDTALGCSNKDADMLRKHSQRTSASLVPQRPSNLPGTSDLRVTDNRSSPLSGSVESWQRKRPVGTSDSDTADVQDHLSGVKRRRLNVETGRKREGSLQSPSSHPLLVSASAKNLQQQERLYSREVGTNPESRPSTEGTSTLTHLTARTTSSSRVEPPKVSNSSSGVRSIHPLTFSPTKHNASQVLGECIPTFPSPVGGPPTSARPSTLAGPSTSAGPSTLAGLSTLAGPSTSAGLSTLAGPSTLAGLSTSAGLSTLAGPSTSGELDYHACFPAPPPSVLPRCDREWRPHGGPRKRVAHQDTTTIQKCRSVVAASNKWHEPPQPRSDTQKKRKKSLRDDLLNSKW